MVAEEGIFAMGLGRTNGALWHARRDLTFWVWGSVESHEDKWPRDCGFTEKDKQEKTPEVQDFSECTEVHYIEVLKDGIVKTMIQAGKAILNRLKSIEFQLVVEWDCVWGACKGWWTQLESKAENLIQQYQGKAW